MPSHSATKTQALSVRIGQLQEMPVFGGLRRDTLEHMLQSAEWKCVPAGDQFYEAGEEEQGMFVLLEGDAVATLNDDTSCFVVREFAAGDSFGEAAGIDLQPRSYTVNAQSDCVAVYLAAPVFMALQTHDVEQFALFYMNIAREFSRRLRESEASRFQSWCDHIKE